MPVFDQHIFTVSSKQPPKSTSTHSRPLVFLAEPESRDGKHLSRSIEATETETEKKSSLDFTQRIEKKLAEYNASENTFKRWIFEMTSWFISASCMIAIIVIYGRIQNQPLNTTSLFLTLTNVLGKVSSAALIVPTSEALGQLKWNWFHKSKAMWDFEIFDKASRGPLGALMLLFRTKGRSLAAFGALLIVLLLAIDAFFQQVVEMSDRWTLQTTEATAPKAYSYDPGHRREFRDGSELSQDDRDTFLIIEKFSYGNGTQPVPFGPGVRPEIPVSCPTSNCTWPLYETLGVCSQCADISSHLSFACLEHTVDWTADSQGLFDLQKPYPNATACGYFLNATSENPILMSGYLWNTTTLTVGEALTMRNFPLTDIITKQPMYGNGSLFFKEIRHKIQDVFVVSSNDGTAEAVYRNETPIAQECHLSWCVKTMSSSYTLGGYSEEVVDILFNTTSGPFPWEAYPYETETENGTDIFYIDGVTINVATAINNTGIIGFGTSNYTMMAILQGFIDIFPAYTTMKNQTASSVLRYKTWQAGAPWQQIDFFNPWLAPNNVPKHMERLATALTNVIRSAPSRQDVEGLAFSKETFITVRWEYLAFPLLLLVLSLVFLIATMVKTSKDSGTAIWKTSTMPTLIYSLPKETQGQFNESSTWSSAKRTKKVRVRLHPKNGWRVSGQSHLSTSPQLPRPAVQAPRGWI